MVRSLFLIILLNSLSLFTDAAGVRAEQAKPGAPAAKVYVDGVFKGPANKTIEAIPVGEHAISCRTETKSVNGTYVIGNAYVHKWEARFDTLRFRSIAELEPIVQAVEPPPPVVIEPQVEVPAARPVKVKKAAAEPAKKEKAKTADEDRRDQHLNIIKVAFEDRDAQEVRISPATNPRTVGKFTKEAKQSGAYFRTKKNLLLCETGPCEQQWSSSFQYTDEAGKSDAFSLIWKRTVFSGMTPDGTSKYELVCCLNGVCQTLSAAGNSSAPAKTDMGRYTLTWTRSLLLIKRSDLAEVSR